MICSIVTITIFQNQTNISDDFGDAVVLIVVKFTTNWREKIIFVIITILSEYLNNFQHCMVQLNPATLLTYRGGASVLENDMSKNYFNDFFFNEAGIIGQNSRIVSNLITCQHGC